MDSQILVLLRRGSLFRSDESSTDPNTLCAVHQTGSESTPVVNTASSDDMNLILSGISSNRCRKPYRSAGERRLLALANVDTSGDQDRGGGSPSVSSTFTSLGADEVHTDIQCLLNVLGRTDHLLLERSHRIRSENSRSCIQFLLCVASPPPPWVEHQRHKRTALPFPR